MTTCKLHASLEPKFAADLACLNSSKEDWLLIKQLKTKLDVV